MKNYLNVSLNWKAILRMDEGLAQWLGCWSLASRHFLLCAQPMVDRWSRSGKTVCYESSN